MEALVNLCANKQYPTPCMHIVPKAPYAKQGDDWFAYPCAFENLPDFPFKDTAKTLSSVCNVPKDNDKVKKMF